MSEPRIVPFGLDGPDSLAREEKTAGPIRSTYEPKQLPAVPAERLAHPNTPKTAEYGTPEYWKRVWGKVAPEPEVEPDPRSEALGRANSRVLRNQRTTR